MQLRHFVSGSAVFLGGWLAVTFVYEVPSQSYPKRNKQATASGLQENSTRLAAVKAPESAVVQVSHSR